MSIIYSTTNTNARKIAVLFCLYYLMKKVAMITAKRCISVFVVKKSESSNKTIRMPNDLIDRLEGVAKDKDVSFSQLVIQCCAYALGQMEGSAELPKNQAKNE